jgi:hypothetical protein
MMCALVKTATIKNAAIVDVTSLSENQFCRIHERKVASEKLIHNTQGFLICE